MYLENNTGGGFNQSILPFFLVRSEQKKGRWILADSSKTGLSNQLGNRCCLYCRQLQALFAEHHQEALQRRLPVVNRFPVPRRFLNRHERRLESGIVVRKDTQVAGARANGHLQRFDCVGGVDHLANLRQQVEQRNDVFQLLRHSRTTVLHLAPQSSIKASSSRNTPSRRSLTDRSP